MKLKFAVIGLGSFGSTVALELIRLGHEVLGIDIRDAMVNKHAEQLTQSLIADATDEKVIEELGLKHYDGIVVAIGENLEASILSTMALKNAGCAQVWVKAITDTHHRILSRLQADRIIHPEHEIGVRVAQSLTHPQMLDYISLGNGWFVVEIQVNERIAGHRNYAQDMQFNDIQLTLVKRGRSVLPPPYRELVLQPGDQIVLAGELDNLLKFAKQIF